MITVVGNLKGGSGKSTVAFNLAVWISTRGGAVEAFDLDPQRTLSDVSEVREEEGFEPFFKLRHGGKELRKHLTSAKAEVLVDVGSSDMKSMQTALAVADRVLVPVPPSQADIWSTQRFLGIVAEAAGDRPEVCLFVNRADTHHAIRESDEAEEALALLAGTRLVGERLHQRTAFRRSFSEGLGVFELEPSGKAAAELNRLAAVLYPDYA